MSGLPAAFAPLGPRSHKRYPGRSTIRCRRRLEIVEAPVRWMFLARRARVQLWPAFQYEGSA